MAGSLSHIVDSDGTFTMDLIDHTGDAGEALEECFDIIFYLAGGDTGKVREACKALGYSDPWANEYGDDLREPMRTRRKGALRPKPETCVWTYDPDDEFWYTSCGRDTAFSEGTPSENGNKFCSFCGKKVEVKG